MEQSTLSVLSTTKDAVIWVMDQLNTFEDAEVLCVIEVPVYKDALNRCTSSIDTLYRAFSEYYDPRHELVIAKIKILQIHIKALTETVQKLIAWHQTYKEYDETTCRCMMSCMKKVAYVAVTLPRDLLNELNERKLALLPIVNELLNVERDTVGSAMTVTHPVLRKAWMMCGRNDIEESRVAITVLADNVLQLLFHEMNENIDSLSKLEYELYSGRVLAFLKGLDCALQKHGEPDGYLTTHELNTAHYFENLQKNDNIRIQVATPTVFPHMPVHTLLGITPGLLQCMIDPVNITLPTSSESDFLCELKCIAKHVYPEYYGRQIAFDYVEMLCYAEGDGHIEFEKKLPGHWRWSKREVAITVGGQRIMKNGRMYQKYTDKRGAVQLLVDRTNVVEEYTIEGVPKKIYSHKIYADKETPEGTAIRYYVRNLNIVAFIGFQQTFKRVPIYS